MTSEQMMNALAEPFDLDEVKFKPAVVKGNRAMALAYIDARVIQDRLDGVCGVAGWQDEYTVIEGHSVVCRLRVKIGDEWITKMDVGSPSEQPDEGDRTKAAFSDALKRAAVKFGIGRYLYRLPQIWVDYDPQKKQFARTPNLPAFAMPKSAKPTTSHGAPPAGSPPPAEDKSPLGTVKQFIAREPDLKQLNDFMGKMPLMNKGEKEAAWDTIKTYAAAKDWEFDAKSKKFAGLNGVPS